jgi:hypothetical protein
MWLCWGGTHKVIKIESDRKYIVGHILAIKKINKFNWGDFILKKSRLSFIKVFMIWFDIFSFLMILGGFEIRNEFIELFKMFLECF